VDLAQDVGPSLCESIRAGMMTEEPEYFERTARGYRWWPHRFCQRIEARAAVVSHGVAVCRVDVETPVLENVESTPEALARLAAINEEADLSAAILDEDTGVVSFFASVSAHAQNREVADSLAKHAVSLQAALAERMRPKLVELFGQGRLIEPELPGGGFRSEADEMTRVIPLLHAPHAANPSAFVEHDEFERANMEVASLVSVLTSVGEHGLTAEFKWGEGPSQPAILQALRRHADGADPTGPSTSLYRMYAHYHNRLGNGAAATLSLPCDVDPQDGPKHANALNAWERSVDVFGHQLGAWTCQDRTLRHVRFLSNFCWFAGIGSVLMQDDAMRSMYMSGLMT